jgi:DNA (cytosine-5)-methyltransferase 1
MAMRLLDLFSGIGGFSYAAEKLIGGYETVAFCEMDEFCQKVLKKHWPQVPIFDDVRTLDAARLGRIDICTFGFPCQPVSQAGLQRAESDSRWLWDEIIRILQVSKPKWIIAENVVGLITIENGLLIENCISSLEAEGYEVQSVVIPACAKNAPHRRSRIWLIGQNVDDTNDSTDRAKRGKTREKNSLQKEYRQEGFAWFSDRTSDDSESMADTTSKGKWKITKGLGESQKEMGEKRSEFTTRSDTSSTETGTNVADTESIRCRGGSCKGCSDCKRQVLSTERKGREVGSEVEGCSQSHRENETVTNTDNEGLQGHGEHRQLEREQREKQFAENHLQNEHRTNRKFEQRVGNMADGISTGLLRHFDREPEHIPRVTKGEKDRAKKLKALGNSIVPQVAAEILLAIRVSEESD